MDTSEGRLVLRQVADLLATLRHVGDAAVVKAERALGLDNLALARYGVPFADLGRSETMLVMSMWSPEEGTRARKRARGAE